VILLAAFEIILRLPFDAQSPQNGRITKQKKEIF
jgi:hypothetical protein